MPKRGKLARGRYWARWRIYYRTASGSEESRRAEKIIDRDLAEQMGVELANDGPLNKTDARKVLERLIRETNEDAEGVQHQDDVRRACARIHRHEPRSMG